MLSDEEREALRNFKSEYETCNHNSSDLIIELDDAKIILKLIKKQIKINEKLFKGYNARVNDILELEKKVEELENFDLTTVCLKGFYDGEKKWKDKIMYWLDRFDLEEELQNEYDELFGCEAAVKILKKLLEDKE